MVTRRSRAGRLPNPTPRSALVPIGASLVLAALVLAGCSGGQGGYQYNWDILWDSLFGLNQRIMAGLFLTVVISVISQVIGVVLGVFAAIGRLSRHRSLRSIAGVYIWIFRGTPLLVQLAFVFYGLGVAGIYKWPDLVFGPLTILGAVQAGIFTLGINEGAYMAEIVRAGIISIDPGQMEAAKSLGMTYGKAMRRIVLPQAARVIVPPLGNEFNNMLKTTSLLVIIAVPELFVTFENLNGSGPTSFHPIELFLAAAIWYLLLTTIWSFIQGIIERRLAKGAPGAAGAGPSFRERMFGLRSGGPEDVSLVSGGR
ncbi:MAG TPA: amino acid ABC transporter permease [Candidatus Dormibacteraeota bacterium]|nr:amino acid ABC transporter permease [Candidatus Dormibacteraeota bacterium]